MTLIADVFLELPAPRNMINDKCLTSRVSEDPQHGQWIETLFQSERENLYHYVRENVFW